MKQNYSFWKSLLKTVIKLFVFLVPLLVPLLPQAWMDITVGGILYMGADWLQKKYTTL